MFFSIILEPCNLPQKFIMRLSTALHGTTEDKLKWMFHIYDVDGDGLISKEDLNIVVSAVHNLIGTSGPGDNHAINKQVLRIFEVSFSSYSLIHCFFIRI